MAGSSIKVRGGGRFWISGLGLARGFLFTAGDAGLSGAAGLAIGAVRNLATSTAGGKILILPSINLDLATKIRWVLSSATSMVITQCGRVCLIREDDKSRAG
jgi:hypothetical protein